MLESSPVRSLHHSYPSVLDLGVWMCCGDFSAGVVVLASIGELNAPFGSRLTLWLVGLTAIQKRCHCLLYTSPSPRDGTSSRMPSSA